MRSQSTIFLLSLLVVSTSAQTKDYAFVHHFSYNSPDCSGTPREFHEIFRLNQCEYGYKYTLHSLREIGRDYYSSNNCDSVSYVGGEIIFRDTGCRSYYGTSYEKKVDSDFPNPSMGPNDKVEVYYTNQNCSGELWRINVFKGDGCDVSLIDQCINGRRVSCGDAFRFSNEGPTESLTRSATAIERRESSTNSFTYSLTDTVRETTGKTVAEERTRASQTTTVSYSGSLGSSEARRVPVGTLNERFSISEYLTKVVTRIFVSDHITDTALLSASGSYTRYKSTLGTSSTLETSSTLGSSGYTSTLGASSTLGISVFLILLSIFLLF